MSDFFAALTELHAAMRDRGFSEQECHNATAILCYESGVALGSILNRET